MPPPPPQLASAPLSSSLKLMWQHPPVRGSFISDYALEMMPMSAATALEVEEVRFVLGQTSCADFQRRELRRHEDMRLQPGDTVH
jgi:hypothetical protein